MLVEVCFTAERKPDLVSKLIMQFMGTNYSHVLFKVGGEVFHATGEGVNRIPVSEYLGNKKIIVHQIPVVLDCTANEFYAYMLGANGKEYSSSQYLGFLFKPLRKLVSNGEEKQICSELVARVLHKWAGIEFHENLDFISPRDVFERIEGSKDAAFY